MGYFHVLAIVNNVAVNIGMHVSFQISVVVSFGYIHRNGVAGSCGSSKLQSYSNQNSMVLAHKNRQID